MSRVEVYRIALDGEVCRYDEARNASACLPWIWKNLAKKYGVKDPFDYSDRRIEHGKVEPLWELRGTGKMTPADETLLIFTFDASWCAKENIPKLCAALEEFWRNYHTMVDWNGAVCAIDDTIPRLVAILKRLATETDCQGACFNQTSVNSNPWVVRLETDDAEDNEPRPFVFGQDTVDVNGADPVDIFGSP
jgi:hypothetical protein